MTIPKPGETVHLMNWLDVVRTRWKMRGRNAQELKLYTTDDLRRLYHADADGDLIRLRDGLVSRAELVAEIRWRTACGRFGYFLLLGVSVAAMLAAIAAAWEGRATF